MLWRSGGRAFCWGVSVRMGVSGGRGVLLEGGGRGGGWVNEELLDRIEGAWHDKASERGGGIPQAAGSSILTLGNESDVRFFF